MYVHIRLHICLTDVLIVVSSARQSKPLAHFTFRLVIICELVHPHHYIIKLTSLLSYRQYLIVAPIPPHRPPSNLKPSISGTIPRPIICALIRLILSYPTSDIIYGFAGALILYLYSPNRINQYDISIRLFWHYSRPEHDKHGEGCVFNLTYPYQLSDLVALTHDWRLGVLKPITRRILAQNDEPIYQTTNAKIRRTSSTPRFILLSIKLPIHKFTNSLHTSAN